MTGVDQMVGMKVSRGMGTWLIPIVVDDDFDKVRYRVLRKFVPQFTTWFERIQYAKTNNHESVVF